MTQPYLSLVVPARNDDHGGNLLNRMQAFVNGWIGQAKAHRISCELVIVEWNPDPARPLLRDALRWPEDLGPCEVRFIEVPPELHQRFSNPTGMPLYQMIAKNVGIRRARGKFILSATLDLLFSSELAAFLAEQRLEPGRMYRVDRYDVMSDVPVDAPVEEQLAYCRTHLLRVSTRYGTLRLTPDGQPAQYQIDVSGPSSGIRFSQGWYPPERMSHGPLFRWAGKHAEVLLDPVARGAQWILDLKPGPSLRGAPLQLEVKTSDGQRLLRKSVRGWKRLRIPVPDPAPARLHLIAREGGEPIGNDPRLLTMQVFRLDWGPRFQIPGSGLAHLLSECGRMFRLCARALEEERAAFTLPFRNPDRLRLLAARLASKGNAVGNAADYPAGLPSPEMLHTTAAGDFTMMARENWFDLRGYPEFEVSAMNLDMTLCYAAHYGGAREEFLPMPIYHIEHATGSGWTPEGEEAFFSRLASRGIPFIPHQEVLRWASQMRQLKSPMIFNREDWGLASFELKETVLQARATVR